MILFVVDQIAGAEYILPLLHGPLQSAAVTVVASHISSRLLTSKSIVHRELQASTLETVRDVVKELKPSVSLLSASSGSDLEKHFVAALKEERIPCIQFVDMWTNYKLRFNLHDQMSATFPDLILTLDHQSRTQMEMAGIPGGLIEVVGQPYFEAMLVRYSKVTACRKDRTLIVTQPVSRFYGGSLGYDESTFLKLSLGGLAAVGADLGSVDICVHPAESVETYESIVKDISHQISFIPNGTLDMKRYKFVLGMFSSLMIQAMMSGAAVASVQPGAHGADACYIPNIERIHNLDDLEQWLSKNQAHDTQRPLDTFKFLEGSAQRVASLLTDGYKRRIHV